MLSITLRVKINGKLPVRKTDADLEEKVDERNPITSITSITTSTPTHPSSTGPSP